MEMTGEQRIEASRDKVWAALNDPDVLKQCIPGCQSLEKTAEDRMQAVAAVKVGPIGARFTGEVTLSDLDPPNGYRITGEGQGGPAGFAKGGAQVKLREDGAATVLSYEVTAQVGGKLAQLGGGLIDATAKQMAGTFFRRLSEVLAEPVETAPAPEAAGGETAAPVAVPAASGPAKFPVAWVVAVAAAGVGGVLLGHGGLGEPGAVWSGFAAGLLSAVVGAVGFGLGRREPRA